MNFLKFLGTAGARFVVIQQLRASGGIWFNLGSTNLLVDPGPGCLIRCIKSRPTLDPRKLDGIFLSHRHLDHSADMNIMVEAMTNGGLEHRGTVFLPSDALGNEPVLFSYLQKNINQLLVLKEGEKYTLNDIILEIPVRHIHGVETYGFILRSQKCPILSYIPDTRFFHELADAYKASQIMIINTVLAQPKNGVDHLCLSEAEEIIGKVRPSLAYLTHFGMTILRMRIWEKVAEISKRTGIKVIAATDGMTVDLESF